MDERRPLRTFGRIKARSLKPRQAALLDALLPHLAVPEEGDIDLVALFSGEGAGGGASFNVVLEVGFGGGEHLAAQAAAHPDTRFIGVEPFLNGVASCLRHIEEQNLQNVRLHMGDARDVVARLPSASLGRVDILFPDPWPKARHHKRRLIQPEFLDALARVMKPGAELRFATDWADYAEHTLFLLTRDARFAWTANRPDDWRKPWPGHVMTRYEQKRLGDCSPIWLSFVSQTDGPEY